MMMMMMIIMIMRHNYNKFLAKHFIMYKINNKPNLHSNILTV